MIKGSQYSDKIENVRYNVRFIIHKQVWIRLILVNNYLEVWVLKLISNWNPSKSHLAINFTGYWIWKTAVKPLKDKKKNIVNSTNKMNNRNSIENGPYFVCVCLYNDQQNKRKKMLEKKAIR